MSYVSGIFPGSQTGAARATSIKDFFINTFPNIFSFEETVTNGSSITHYIRIAFVDYLLSVSGGTADQAYIGCVIKNSEDGTYSGVYNYSSTIGAYCDYYTTTDSQAYWYILNPNSLFISFPQKIYSDNRSWYMVVSKIGDTLYGGCRGPISTTSAPYPTRYRKDGSASLGGFFKTSVALSATPILENSGEVLWPLFIVSEDDSSVIKDPAPDFYSFTNYNALPVDSRFHIGTDEYIVIYRGTASICMRIN